ncbi:PREDICTED: uncharacterized protein LOC100636621 [Amphimedon queenslandica]|uniref:Ribosomal protein S11 n=1 Tax=Amphimedon queenslandica TaxID=400682 RepID=A0A1X7UXX4_AMPQE|nr:PREDICTED: uncharacterized protein LOC100636621 [Amphimedon queenslandica]|eukprot:XP_003386425.2 PREDICTED: uncharacterized protein LOC100636621 [Amphimedon queenslandica]
MAFSVVSKPTCYNMTLPCPSFLFKTVRFFSKHSIGITTLNHLPIIHVNATFNNTIVTVTDSDGKTVAWSSGGLEGYRNARKGTTFAAQSAGLTAAKKALDFGFSTVRVRVKGVGPGRQSAVKGIEVAGVSIAMLQDVTPVPHNGCRAKKPRRL